MRRSLLAAALVPLALGDYSYDYSVPTMAPTTETAQPTLEVCPVLVGLDASECPLGFLNETYPACMEGWGRDGEREREREGYHAPRALSLELGGLCGTTLTRPRRRRRGDLKVQFLRRVAPA